MSVSLKNKRYRLTKTLCENRAKLTQPAKGNKLYFDEKCAGLAFRVTAAGSTSWVLSYKLDGGPERRITIGRFPAIQPAEARDVAGDIQAEVRQNIDPLEVKNKKRNAYTIEGFCEYYLENHSRPNLRPSSIVEDERSCRDFIAYFGKRRKFKDLTRPDIRRWHQSFRNNKSRTGNKMLAMLSVMYNLAISDEIDGIQINLCVGIERHPEVRRERFLSVDELQQFKDSLYEYMVETRELIKTAPLNRDRLKAVYLVTELRLFEFLLLTGCRIGEAINAHVKDITLAIDENGQKHGTWYKDSAHTKQKKKHIVPLSPLALKELLAWGEEPKRCESDYIFPGSLPDKPITHPRKTWLKLMERAEIENFRPHDLRHSFASYAVMHGVPLTIVGGLLGHTQAATTHRYAHLDDKSQRDATTLVGAVLAGIGSNGDEE
jgi:integrase